jgi:protein phosphatase
MTTNHNEHFTFETGQATDVGCLREVNEDNFLSRPDYGLWVVADGMGGHAAGDFASLTIVKELNSVGVPASDEDLKARFMDRLSRANDLIIAHAAELNTGTVGATVVSLLVHEDQYSCIWSGDSRVYLLRNGQLAQQSRDHTEVRALLDAGSITAEEAENWPRKNVITRAIGVTSRPQCDMISGKLAEGDVFLLCSDGLTEHIEDVEIAEILQKVPPQMACDALIEETLKRGARDNVTVVVMRCLPPPPVTDDDLALDEAADLS